MKEDLSPDKVEEIVRWLRRQEHEGRTAREVARGVGVGFGREILKALYGLEKSGHAVRESGEPPKWRSLAMASGAPKSTVSDAVGQFGGAIGAEHRVDAAGPVYFDVQQHQDNPLQLLAALSASIPTPASPPVTENGAVTKLEPEPEKPGSAPNENSTSALYIHAQKNGRRLHYEFHEKDAATMTYTCEVYVDGLVYGRSTDLRKKNAKHLASELAMRRIAEEEGKKGGEDKGAAEENKECLQELHTYAAKHRLEVQWKELDGPDARTPPFKVAVQISGRIFEHAEGSSKKIAKRAAAAKALKALSGLRVQDTGWPGEVASTSAVVTSGPKHVADLVARAIHQKFTELVGAEERMRPREVLAGFAYVHRESLQVQVVSLAYAELRADAREHPALIAHRALLRSLADELGMGEQDPPRGRLLESFMGERGQKPLPLRCFCTGRETSENFVEKYNALVKISRGVQELTFVSADQSPAAILTVASFQPPTSQEPRKTAATRVYWSFRDDDLGLEDLQGFDPLSGQPSSISPSQLALACDALRQSRIVQEEQKQRSQEQVKRERQLFKWLARGYLGDEAAV